MAKKKERITGTETVVLGQKVLRDIRVSSSDIGYCHLIEEIKQYLSEPVQGSMQSTVLILWNKIVFLRTNADEYLHRLTFLHVVYLRNSPHFRSSLARVTPGYKIDSLYYLEQNIQWEN